MRRSDMKRMLGSLLCAVLCSANAASAQDVNGMRLTSEVENARSEVAAGLRFATNFIHTGAVRDATAFRIFGQLLVGGRASDIGLSGRAIQPGAGVDFYVRNGITIRNSIDYCIVSGPGRGVSGGRWLVSVVV